MPLNKETKPWQRKRESNHNESLSFIIYLRIEDFVIKWVANRDRE